MCRLFCKWLAGIRAFWRVVWLYRIAGIGAVGEGVRVGRRVRIEGNVAAIHIGRYVTIGDNVSLICNGPDAKLILEDGCHLHHGVVLDTGLNGSIHLGSLNSVNPYCVIYGHGGLSTGHLVRIAAHTVIIPANHKFSETDTPIARQGLSKQGIQIDDDVWIGAGARILDGVHIGRGVVVGAGSVVTQSIPSMTVVVGVPARVLKIRVDDTDNQEKPTPVNR